MAEFAWEPDIPSGVLRNHALSEKIREAAVAEAKFIQFCDPESGYGRGQGDTLTITRIRNIAEPTTAKFNERDRVPIDTLAVSTKAVTVSYFGRGVEYTRKAELLTHFDLRDKIQRKLRQQMTLSLDTAAAAAFKTAQVKYIPTSLTGGTFDTDGTASTSATENLTVAHVKIIRDQMMDTYHTPGYKGDEYVCLASTKACRGIKNDPEWQEFRKYLDPGEAHYKGEIGRVENIRFVEVNHTNALANNKGTGAVLGEAVFFGDDAVAIALVEDPELRAAIPGNFGLAHAVAWIGLLEFTIIWDTANDGEVRVIHLTSS